MRVISQDGTIDVPYEYISLVISIAKCKDVEHVCIYCHNISAPHGTRLAEYSTEAKAIKVMEMLRERHTDNAFCREDIQYKAEIMLDDGLDIVREMMMKCEYFQFPKDDEIEV
jgi:hypothetical protein